MIFIGLFLFFALILYVGIAHILPSLYWFEAMGYAGTYLTQLGYKLGSFALFFSVIFSLYAINARLTRTVIQRSKFTIPNEPSSPLWHQFKKIIGTLLSGYTNTTQKISNGLKWAGLVTVSLLTAKVGSHYWHDIVLSFYAQPFHISDPIFNKDVSFFVFLFPIIGHVIGLLKFVAITSLLYSLWHYVQYGFFGLFFTKTHYWVRGHVLGMLALIFGLFSASAYQAKFQLLFKNNGIIHGLGYTDANVYLNAIGVLPVIWVGLALLAILLIFRLSLRWTLAGVIGYGAFHMIGLTLIPSLIQNYVVAPNEFKKEIPFIKHNIHYTQLAYQLDAIENVDIAYQKKPIIKNDPNFRTVLNNARLWNPGPLKSTLKQLQEIRLYYEFQTVDIDRYMVNNQPQQVMVSARELDIQQISQKAQTWVNKHLIFTHGYGLCMVPVNQFNAEGLPELLIRDIPPVSKSNIVIDRPEIYFGEATNHYVIANTRQKEFDYPKDNENRYTHYSGTGGIALDSFFKRLVFAIKLRDIKLLISQNIHGKSRLLFDRNVHLIPQKITPFITYDRDPYLVVHRGRLIWMIDGYTASSHFPYATPYSQNTNYIRNSVVATVDAYSGETHFYIKDDKDPIIMSTHAMYPSLLKPLSDMPNDLKAHIRFPKDLFKVVSTIYNTYHMTDPQVFYNKEDVWTFPTETYDSETGITMDPYYMYFNNQVSHRNEYVMMLPLTPSNKNNLVSILTASCEPDNFGKLTVYKYPKQETVYGPLQIESRIDQNTDISKDLTLWGQVGSRVIRGNLMVIPYKNAIFYIEPIYLQATQSKLPELKRVIVAAGDKVTMTPSIADGIRELTNSPMSATISEPVSTTDTKNELTKKIIDTYSRAKDRLKSSDWVNFGLEFKTLDQLIRQLRKDR
jgi:uncharacterized membrane protein (UPF0182 family)